MQKCYFMVMLLSTQLVKDCKVVQQTISDTIHKQGKPLSVTKQRLLYPSIVM